MSTREMSAACATILIVFVIGVAINLAPSRSADAGAWTVRGDFVEFYTAGRMLHEGKAGRLYDVDLADEMYREVVPGASAFRLPFVYPPLVAAVFRPLARLSYPVALTTFLVVTPLLYVASLMLLNAVFGPTRNDEQALLLLAGLSFFPFIGYTWLGAQISVIGFAALTVAVCAEDRGQPFVSGLALSLALYKPSLLVLILPMLLLSGRYRQLGGFAAGAALLAAASLLAAGPVVMRIFVEKVLGMVALSTTNAGRFNPWRYVDLNAFFRLLPFGRSVAGYALLAIVAAAIVTVLVLTWWRSRAAVDRATRLLIWAATLTWTLVVNIYTPFYDTILVVAAAVLAAAASRERGWTGWNRLAPALLCLYAAPWISEVIAQTLRVQIYTLVLAWFGIVVLRELRDVRANM